MLLGGVFVLPPPPLFFFRAPARFGEEGLIFKGLPHQNGEFPLCPYIQQGSKDTPLALPGSWGVLLRAAWPPRRRPSVAATTTPRTHRTCTTAPRRVWFCVENSRRFVLKTEDPPNCPPDEWRISCVASYGYVPSFPAPERHAATSLRSSNLRAIATLSSELTNRSLHHRSLHHTLVIRRHCRPHF